jgi:CspA family cold shock protein
VPLQCASEDDNGRVIKAIVREWHEKHGWGVVDATETPGGCWVHYSHLDMDGYRSLSGVTVVRLDYEAAQQDGYSFRAVRVEVPGIAPSTGDDEPDLATVE